MEQVLIALVGLLGGCNIFQFIFFRQEKAKATAEANSARTDSERRAFELDKDQVDYIMDSLSKVQGDYMALLKSVRDSETEHTNLITEKCNEIAVLKSKVTYLSGLRCYKSDCSLRIKLNPNKKEVDNDNAL